jgi:O-methyltransferase involved in polyketide biosynthesis
MATAPVPATLAGLAETAFIPLVARALAAERFPEIGFRDRTAEAIYAAMQPELGPYVGGYLSMLAVIARSWMLDQIVGVFTSRHSGAQIVDLGAGLSTRFERIDNGMLTWIDVDVAPVIALRQTLFPVNERRRMVVAEVGSPGWIERLALAPAPTMIVAEGLLVYMPPAMVESVMRDIAAGVPGRPCELAFDYVHPLLVGRASVNPVLRRMSARSGAEDVCFRWGVRRPADLAPPGSGWQLVGAHPVYERIGFPYALWSSLFRAVAGGHVHGIAHLVRSAQPKPMPARKPAPGASSPAAGRDGPPRRAARPAASPRGS